MAILEPIKTDDLYKYESTESIYFVIWQNAENWSIKLRENISIVTPEKLFIQTTVTTQGRIDLITYVENYTP